ncbi:MAG: hypothetical protein JSS79_08220 [Bacteroidetes bacterium]|nr:hypothetical protein [Bacteroidota bacterium]
MGVVTKLSGNADLNHIRVDAGVASAVLIAAFFMICAEKDKWRPDSVDG